MKSLLFLAIYGDEVSFGESLIISLIAILIVFLVLGLIIASITLMKVIMLNANKKANLVSEVVETPKAEEVKSVEITDDDMMVAALIATIDYTNETKKDVRLKSIKRIG